MVAGLAVPTGGVIGGRQFEPRRRQAGAESEDFLEAARRRPRQPEAHFDAAQHEQPRDGLVIVGGFGLFEERPSVAEPAGLEQEPAELHVGERGRAVRLPGCGIGRGGGAGFLFRTFAPRSYTGIDVSGENIRMARRHSDGPRFEVGDAEKLGFDAGTFDVAVNIEASHLYADRRAFFAEVFRVLRPGGDFCYTDGCWADDDCSDDLRAAGFVIEERLEITDNVIRSLELDNERKEKLFDGLGDPELVREYKDWGGIVGFRAWRRFVERETLYFSHRLRRP